MGPPLNELLDAGHSPPDPQRNTSSGLHPQTMQHGAVRTLPRVSGLHRPDGYRWNANNHNNRDFHDLHADESYDQTGDPANVTVRLSAHRGQRSDGARHPRGPGGYPSQTDLFVGSSSDSNACRIDDTNILYGGNIGGSPQQQYHQQPRQQYRQPQQQQQQYYQQPRQPRQPRQQQYYQQPRQQQYYQQPQPPLQQQFYQQPRQQQYYQQPILQQQYQQPPLQQQYQQPILQQPPLQQLYQQLEHQPLFDNNGTEANYQRSSDEPNLTAAVPIYEPAANSATILCSPQESTIVRRTTNRNSQPATVIDTLERQAASTPFHDISSTRFDIKDSQTLTSGTPPLVNAVRSDVLGTRGSPTTTLPVERNEPPPKHTTTTQVQIPLAAAKATDASGSANQVADASGVESNVRAVWRPRRAAVESPRERRKREIKSILNKLTVERFPLLAEKLARVVERVDTPDELDACVRAVFEAAVSEPNFSELYGDVFQVMRYRAPVLIFSSSPACCATTPEPSSQGTLSTTTPSQSPPTYTSSSSIRGASRYHPTSKTIYDMSALSSPPPELSTSGHTGGLPHLCPTTPSPPPSCQSPVTIHTHSERQTAITQRSGSSSVGYRGTPQSASLSASSPRDYTILRSLIKIVQEQFQRMPHTFDLTEEGRYSNSDKDEQLRIMFSKKIMSQGLCRIIGELLVRGLIKAVIVQHIIQDFLTFRPSATTNGDMTAAAARGDTNLPSELLIEAVCQFCCTAGSFMDERPATAKFLIQILGRLSEVQKHESCSLRLSCIIQDLLDARKAKWHCKAHREGAKALSQIKDETDRAQVIGGLHVAAQAGRVIKLGERQNLRNPEFNSYLKAQETLYNRRQQK